VRVIKNLGASGILTAGHCAPSKSDSVIQTVLETNRWGGIWPGGLARVKGQHSGWNRRWLLANEIESISNRLQEAWTAELGHIFWQRRESCG